MEITTPQGTLKGDSIEAILRKYGRDTCSRRQTWRTSAATATAS